MYKRKRPAGLPLTPGATLRHDLAEISTLNPNWKRFKLLVIMGKNLDASDKYYQVQIDFPECVGFEEVKAQAKASGCIKNYKFTDKINFPLIRNCKCEFHKVVLNSAKVKELQSQGATKYITQAQMSEIAMFISDRGCKKITKSIPKQGGSNTDVKNIAEYPLAAAYVNEALYFARVYSRTNEYTLEGNVDGLNTEPPNVLSPTEFKFDDFSNIPASGYQILDNKLYLYIRKTPFDGRVGQELEVTIDYELKPVTLENLYWHNQNLEDYKPTSFKWDYFEDNSTFPYIMVVGNAGSFKYAECDFKP